MRLESEVIQAEGGIIIIALKGRLLAGSSLTVTESQVKTLIKQGTTKLVLDLAQVEHADSSGFCLLLHAYTALRAVGGQLRIASPNERLLALFRLTQTDHLLTICADRSDSIQSLRRKSGAKNGDGAGSIKASNN